jgi:hypothetical protein
MFPLYDHTRRQICMATFLGLCVLPTLAIAGLSISRHLPWHKQFEAQRLGQELGVDVSIESIEHTLPGRVRYADVKLTDPETGRELFRCAELAATWTSMTDKHGETRPAIKLVCSQVESASGDWNRLYEILRRPLECQGGRPETELRVTADHWTLHDGTQTQVLDAVEGGLGFTDGIQARLDFRLPEIRTDQPLRMRIVRNRQISPPANEFDIDTGGCPIPVRLLASCLREVGGLGPDCTFAGHAVANSGPDGWSGELDGQFRGIDLGRLSHENGLAAISSAADVTMKAVFQRGRIDSLKGRIVTGRGSMSREMLAALVTHLQLNPAPQIPITNESLVFDRVGLDFWIDSSGVSIVGQCGELPGANVAGAVAVVGGRVVLTQPVSQPQRVAALIQALAPANEVPVPATRQAGWLARVLPLPDAVKTR